MERCYLSESYSVCPDSNVCPLSTAHDIGQSTVTIGLHNLLAELRMPVN